MTARRIGAIKAVEDAGQIGPAQSLEQMRSATVLTQENPPVRVLIFIPLCSRPDLFCSLADFEESLERLTTKREP